MIPSTEYYQYVITAVFDSFSRFLSSHTVLSSFVLQPAPVSKEPHKMVSGSQICVFSQTFCLKWAENGVCHILKTTPPYLTKSTVYYVYLVYKGKVTCDTMSNVLYHDHMVGR